MEDILSTCARKGSTKDVFKRKSMEDTLTTCTYPCLLSLRNLLWDIHWTTRYVVLPWCIVGAYRKSLNCYTLPHVRTGVCPPRLILAIFYWRGGVDPEETWFQALHSQLLISNAESLSRHVWVCLLTRPYPLALDLYLLYFFGQFALSSWLCGGTG